MLQLHTPLAVLYNFGRTSVELQQNFNRTLLAICGCNVRRVKWNIFAYFKALLGVLKIRRRPYNFKDVAAKIWTVVCWLNKSELRF